MLDTGTITSAGINYVQAFDLHGSEPFFRLVLSLSHQQYLSASFLDDALRALTPGFRICEITNVSFGSSGLCSSTALRNVFLEVPGSSFVPIED
jgi:hypothetical protein